MRLGPGPGSARSSSRTSASERAVHEIFARVHLPRTDPANARTRARWRKVYADGSSRPVCVCSCTDRRSRSCCLDTTRLLLLLHAFAQSALQNISFAVFFAFAFALGERGGSCCQQAVQPRPRRWGFDREEQNRFGRDVAFAFATFHPVRSTGRNCRRMKGALKPLNSKHLFSPSQTESDLWRDHML